MATGEDVAAAVSDGDTDRLRAILGEDAALASTRDAHGVSALMLARYRSDQDAVALLRAAIPALDVFEAAALGDVGALARRLDADPEEARSWSADGYTPLHFAAFFGGERVAVILLGAGADADAIARNDMRVAPIHSAAAGQGAVVPLLILYGADVNARQQGGWVALHEAAQRGDDSMVDALLGAGADPDARNDDGKSAASIAAEAGHAALADRLAALSQPPSSG
jgi:ankyrin repeat protein